VADSFALRFRCREEKMSKGTVLKVVSYGAVDLVVEQNCHRFETRMTFERWAGVVTGLVGMAVVSFLVVTTITDPVFPWVSYAMAGFLSLVCIPVIYFCLWRKVVLSFTPDAIMLRMRGTLPLARPGTWTWGLEEFAGMVVDKTPFFSRGSQFLRYSVQLDLRGSDRPRWLFFLFDSGEWAEALQIDITSSWRFMVERHNSRLDAEQDGPGHTDDPIHS
jgi:hypothetical protein